MKRATEMAEPSAKRAREDGLERGIATIKAEYRISKAPAPIVPDDDEAEAAKHVDDRDRPGGGGKGGKDKHKSRGQNKNRRLKGVREANMLCPSRAVFNEFSPRECSFGEKCFKLHSLRDYLNSKASDLDAFDGTCPLFEERGECNVGWQCRFIKSHSKEIEHEDGKKELVLVVDEEKKAKHADKSGAQSFGVVNAVDKAIRINLNRKRIDFKKAEKYLEWLDNVWAQDVIARNNGSRLHQDGEAKTNGDLNASGQENDEKNASSEQQAKQDSRATFTDPPYLPSEKRRLYYGPETPILAPLTTQGNLPFRRLCVALGAQITFSEMAMSQPLVVGHDQEWALLKAHESELSSPKASENASKLVPGYNNSQDVRFGAQISAGKPWMALKATEALERYCPRLRAIDLNCGCPIDLVYKQGAGSALMDSPSKLEKILRGMNALSGEIPVTAKIRTGTKDGKPNAIPIVERLILGGTDSQGQGLGGAGIAAVTLHGRSRQQRYTGPANWSYISEVAQTVKAIRNKQYDLTDTAQEPDARHGPSGNGGHVFFVGNGDIYSHADYYSHIENAGIDAVMVGRGALMKPWIFREIEAGQHLDPSSSERLQYISDFCKFGLSAWGADERGIGTTRRFLLEWMSFAYRYVPTGLLERLPPKINERPEAYRGRDEMETLMASDNFRDWIKISDMFLGPVSDDFRFVPKHKSNSYEIEAEG